MKQQSIEILDCTLRDGGYINNWDFGKNANVLIENGLKNSGIEHIESGFLTNKPISPESSTLYNSDINLNNKIVMVNFSEYNLAEVNNNIEIRLAFKKEALGSIEDSLQLLNLKKIKFSLNPMHISLYKQSDFESLFQLSDKYKPTCVTAVDTMGIMTEDDTKRIFNDFDKNLDKNISIGFHSHDNLGLSLSNTIKLLSMDINRRIIIDSCLDGLGRGGGMLSTNVIAQYLNKNYGKHYNLEMLDNLSETYIKNLNTYDKYPYYLSGKAKCHPNYAKYLLEQNLSYTDIERLLKEIPAQNKAYFSEEVIKDIIKRNFLFSKEV